MSVTRSKNVFTLNNGWPFGDGPNEWPIRFEHRTFEDRGITTEQIHVVCGTCPQAIFLASPDLTENSYTVTLDLLKSRIADHALRCHAADLGEAILT